MRCPVCKTECTGFNCCPNCGFDELNKFFVNSDEANLWQAETVEPYRKSFFASRVGILPFDSLSDEQKKALLLPFDKSCLVVGSAGTGKTTVGLNRAFLTHGKVLFLTSHRIAKCLKKELADIAGFRNLQFAVENHAIEEIWTELFDERLPHPYLREADLEVVNEYVLQRGPIYDCIIWDIGTWVFREKEYIFLKTVSKTVYALLDKNTKDKGRFNLDDFIYSLKIGEFAELTQNFRNTYPISCLVSKYCFGAFSFGTRSGEPVQLLRYSNNKEKKFRTISQIVQRNAGRKIGIVVDPDDVDALAEYLKLANVQARVVNCWVNKFQERIFSDEKYIGISAHGDLSNMEFDVAIVMLNDAFKSIPNIDSGNMIMLYRLFSIARDKLYIGISNEIPLNHQGQRIVDERLEFEDFVDFKSYDEV